MLLSEAQNVQVAEAQQRTAFLQQKTLAYQQEISVLEVLHGLGYLADRPGAAAGARVPQGRLAHIHCGASRGTTPPNEGLC